jgi:hypothetical protein
MKIRKLGVVAFVTCLSAFTTARASETISYSYSLSLNCNLSESALQPYQFFPWQRSASNSFNVPKFQARLGDLIDIDIVVQGIGSLPWDFGWDVDLEQFVGSGAEGVTSYGFGSSGFASIAGYSDSASDSDTGGPDLFGDLENGLADLPRLFDGNLYWEFASSHDVGSNEFGNFIGAGTAQGLLSVDAWADVTADMDPTQSTFLPSVSMVAVPSVAATIHYIYIPATGRAALPEPINGLLCFGVAYVTVLARRRIRHR